MTRCTAVRYSRLHGVVTTCSCTGLAKRVCDLPAAARCSRFCAVELALLGVLEAETELITVFALVVDLITLSVVATGVASTWLRLVDASLDEHFLLDIHTRCRSFDHNRPRR